MATDTTQWIMALSHPRRRQILRAIKAGGTTNAAVLSRRLDLPLDNVAYHVKVLVDLNVVSRTT
jgi:DNA-binding transcriptional ArsR family regulator